VRKKTLIACFDVFRDEDVRASVEAYESLKGLSGVSSRLVPVSWAKLGECAADLEKEDFSALLIFGNGRGDSHKLEKLALNAQGVNIADNEGKRCLEDRVEKTGKAACFSTFPTERLEEELLARGIPCQLSYFPGLFLCNALYYKLLRREEEKARPRPVLLFHLSPERKIKEDLSAILEAAAASL